MSTGDIKNNIKQLQHELKAAKFPMTIDVDGLVKGSPKAYLAIYHHLFTTYSTKLNKDIVNSNNELYGKSDMRFMEAVYKILRDMFDYKPQIHREQFFTEGFAERKLIMATDVLRLVGNKYKPLKSSSFRVTATKEEPVLSQKVVQEPVETTRKIASKNQDVVGAVVLPVKKSPGSFKIPKTVFKANYSSSSTSSMDGHFYPRMATSDLIKVNTHEEKDTHNKDSDGGNSTIGQSKGNFTGKLASGTEFIMPDVVPMIMDSLKPILIKLSDRIDKMDSLVQTLQQPAVKETHDVRSDENDNTYVAKWMNDFAFKMDTLTSRVVLIENRLTLLEAKLDREPNKIAKASFVDSKKPPICPANRRSEVTENGVQINPRDNAESVEEDEDGDYGKNVTITDDVQVKVIRADPEQKPIHDSRESQLYSFDDSFNQLHTRPNIRHDSQNPTEFKGLAENKTHTTYKPTDIYSCSLFESFSSPIQKQPSGFDTSWAMDQSLASQFSSQEEGREFGSQEDRRASTPAHQSLDTSTLERVNRINQLMAETQKLFS